ncbi:MAG: hypothetical protein JNL45_09325 [Hyphomicrobium sp.]|jgi:hypothetical protein|nr:hypothetical protein [Hyphomicrobium sp.]
MKTDLEIWNERRRRTKPYIELKREYDLAEGPFVQRVWQASQILNIPYIDCTWMMGAWRDASGAVTPRPENYDEARDAEPPRKNVSLSAGCPWKPRRAE